MSRSYLQDGQASQGRNLRGVARYTEQNPKPCEPQHHSTVIAPLWAGAWDYELKFCA